MNAFSRLGNIFEDVGFKAPARLASTAANLVLSGEQTIDGVAAVDGDRILVAAQTDKTKNGIWQVSTGVWQRTADARNNTDFIDGTLVPVARGTGKAGTLFQLRCTDDPITIDASNLVFTPLADVAGEQQAGTSGTSNAIGTGARSFATQSGKDWSVDQWLLIFQTSNPDNAMLAQIDSYSAGALAVTSVSTGGAGTHTDWTIVLANSPASAGRVPPIGTGNVTGPGSSITGRFATYADATGKVLVDSGIAPGTLAGRDALRYGDAGTATIAEASLVPGAAPLPYCGAQPNDNLHIVNDTTNPNRDYNITPGRCRDDSDVANLHLRGTMVKRLDQAWGAGGLAGAPVGACDSGVKGASETWHQFLIARRGLSVTAFSRTSNVATITIAAHGGGVGGTVRAVGIGSGFDALAVITAVAANTVSYANTGADVALTAIAAEADLYDILASQSYATPTMPSGWTVKQCIGSVLTAASGNIHQVYQTGDEFRFVTVPPVNGNTLSTVPQSYLTDVPNGVSVLGIYNISVDHATSAAAVFVYSPRQSDQAVADLIAPLGTTRRYTGGYGYAGSQYIWTNTTTHIRAVADLSSTTFRIATLGWRDPRRRLF